MTPNAPGHRCQWQNCDQPQGQDLWLQIKSRVGPIRLALCEKHWASQGGEDAESDT